jgi:hypothetical protein
VSRKPSASIPTDRKVYLSPDYKEEQLRAESLNPFFAALGWDMDIVKNTVGKPREGGSPARLTTARRRRNIP